MRWQDFQRARLAAAETHHAAERAFQLATAAAVARLPLAADRAAFHRTLTQIRNLEEHTS